MTEKGLTEGRYRGVNNSSTASEPTDEKLNRKYYKNGTNPMLDIDPSPSRQSKTHLSKLAEEDNVI